MGKPLGKRTRTTGSRVGDSVEQIPTSPHGNLNENQEIEETSPLEEGPYGQYDPRPRAYGPDDLGGGPYNPETGLRDWYNPDPVDSDEPVTKTSIDWGDILSGWRYVECDLHEVFGVDVESGILRERSFRWLVLRIRDLIDRPTRLRRYLNLMNEVT